MLGDKFREKKYEINLVKLYPWMVGTLSENYLIRLIV